MAFHHDKRKEDKHFIICTQLRNSLETYGRKLPEVKGDIHKVTV